MYRSKVQPGDVLYFWFHTCIAYMCSMVMLWETRSTRYNTCTAYSMVMLWEARSTRYFTCTAHMCIMVMLWEARSTRYYACTAARCSMVNFSCSGRPRVKYTTSV